MIIWQNKKRTEIKNYKRRIQEKFEYIKSKESENIINEVNKKRLCILRNIRQ